MVMIGMDTADFCPMGLTTGTGSDATPLELSSAYLAKLEYCFSRPSPYSRQRKYRRFAANKTRSTGTAAEELYEATYGEMFESDRCCLGSR